jgi:hypothetical protein
MFTWSRGSRKHRIGRAHAKYVLAHTTPVLEIGAGAYGDDILRWIGLDDRGLSWGSSASRSVTTRC